MRLSLVCSKLSVVGHEVMTGAPTATSAAREAVAMRVGMRRWRRRGSPGAVRYADARLPAISRPGRDGSA
jgi:hypothetical protein